MRFRRWRRPTSFEDTTRKRAAFAWQGPEEALPARFRQQDLDFLGPEQS